MEDEGFHPSPVTPVNCVYDRLQAPLHPHTQLQGAGQISRFACHLSTAALGSQPPNMLPTALGRIPPLFFSPACSLAPQRKGATLSGTSPAAITLTNLVKASSAAPSLPGVGILMAALICSALMPSGPGAVPFLKDIAGVSDFPC